MTQIVYKYLPIERLTYLDDELLRFTQPLELNDPFEWMPILPSKDEIITIIETVAKENILLIENYNLAREKKRQAIVDYTKKYKDSIKAVLNDEPNNFGEQFYNRAITSLGSKVGLFSLSRRWNSPLMWAHYTNSHKGFCVGFARNSGYFEAKGNPIDPTFIIQPVIYTENRIKVPVERGVKIDPKIVLTKSIDWKYEEEERIITLLTLADKTIETKPYDICLFRIPHMTISEIIVGAKIEEDNFKVIHSFCRKNDIDLYRSRLSDTKFEMERILIK